MTTPATMARKFSHIQLAIILIPLLLALILIFLGLNDTLGGRTEEGSLYLSMGMLVLAFSTYWLFQTRRRILRIMSSEIQPLSTTLQCQKCGFKNVREFQRGDFVFKQTDQACPKDNEKMMISAIYRELKEKQKAKEEGYS
jgi:hypothetical protein